MGRKESEIKMCKPSVKRRKMGVETVGGVMTKLTERNTTTFMMRNTDVHDVCWQSGRVSSFCERAFWCFVVHSDVNWPALSMFAWWPSCRWQFFCTSLRSTLWMCGHFIIHSCRKKNWWTSVTWRTPNLQNTSKNIKGELCSGENNVKDEEGYRTVLAEQRCSSVSDGNGKIIGHTLKEFLIWLVK